MIDKLVKYVNCGYETKARGPETFDCYGLIIAIYKDIFNIELPDFENKYNSPMDKTVPILFIETARDYWKKIDVNSASFGDVFIFNIFGKPRHCGMFVQKNKMIHIMDKSYVTLENPNNLQWIRRSQGVFKYVNG